jgi:hypothetical protein
MTPNNSRARNAEVDDESRHTRVYHDQEQDAAEDTHFVSIQTIPILNPRRDVG